MLAVGAHVKNTIAISVGDRIFVSQHIGDLETPQAYEAFERAIASLGQLYQHAPAAVACDLHPDYLSTQYARRTGRPVVPVQHHYAHVLACMAEHGLEGPALGVAWDGTGLGTDGAIWGGEFLRVHASGFDRVGHLRPFRLPGGDAAVREPRRSALGLLYELYGDDAFEMRHLPSIAAFSSQELRIVRTMLRNRINSPITTSAGRLFDAVASLAGLRQKSQFEGQAAMELEFAASPGPWPEVPDDPPLDWAPLVHQFLSGPPSRFSPQPLADQFHHWLIKGIIAVARQENLPRIILCGGCFQNRRLLEGAIGRLREEGFQPYWPRWIPPNDNGVALGQIIAAARQLQPTDAP